MLASGKFRRSKENVFFFSFFFPLSMCAHLTCGPLSPYVAEAKSLGLMWD